MVNKKKTKGNDFLLYRSETNRVLGGVCGGIGEALNIDPTVIRIIFLITFLFGGAGLLFYFLLWIVIPSKSKVHNTSNETISDNIDEVKTKAKEFRDQIVDSDDVSSHRAIFGAILLGIGVLFLLNNFGYARYFANLGKLWPLFLIVIGFLIISKKDR